MYEYVGADGLNVRGCVGVCVGVCVCVCARGVYVYIQYSVT
jgi:hypothetical protein